MADEEKTEKVSPDEMTEAELRAELEKQFQRQPVADVLMQYMVSLSTLAYAKMGLTEETKDVRDLEQARLAIDSFKALLDSAGDRLGDQDAQALTGALASIQMTFVKASEGEQHGGEAAGQPEAAPNDSGDTSTSPEGEKGDDPASRLWVPGKD